MANDEYKQRLKAGRVNDLQADGQLDMPIEAIIREKWNEGIEELYLQHLHHI